MNLSKLSTKAQDAIKAKLAPIFGTHRIEFTDTGFVLQEKTEEPINLRTLLAVCEALGCAPEQLYWNADLQGSGCPTCGSDYYVELVFEVKD